MKYFNKLEFMDRILNLVSSTGYLSVVLKCYTSLVAPPLFFGLVSILVIFVTLKFSKHKLF